MFSSILRFFSRLFRSRKERRAELLARPFPEEWMPHVLRAVPEFRSFSEQDRSRLRESVQIFLSEKSFLGCRGIDITDQIRVIVAAGACRLLLGLPDLDVFPRLREIIIYPHDFKETIEAIGPDGTRYAIERIRAGEAWRRGPVVLAWNSVGHSFQGLRDGYNVVIHEFAHVIDMQNGEADGIPPLPTREWAHRWESVLVREYRAFVAKERYGEMTLLDPYAATDQAEFFAVATEYFYERPEEMAVMHRELFKLFVDFFGRDPRQWRRPTPTRWFRRFRQ